MPLGVAWTEFEDVSLTIAWLEVSEDATIGTEQKITIFWENVYKSFLEHYVQRSADFEGKEKDIALEEAKKRNRSANGRIAFDAFLN
mgnify:CR=1 FL=1